MGRKQIYITLAEQVEARKKRQMKYYLKNKKKLQNKALKKYYENKRDIHNT
jgi:hypothetical protein